MSFVALAHQRPIWGDALRSLSKRIPWGSTYAPVKHSKLFRPQDAELPHACATWDRAVVLSVARGIEPNSDTAMEWFLNEPIAEFGGKTARQLVEAGETAGLLDMLVAVRGGRRGT